ncbi:MAG TPA: M23 family metallopeptidase, partial [Longimicrobiales bacterium]|nr:M23 family metallopeptidase [Longimicrobiales bacterium]
IKAAGSPASDSPIAELRARVLLFPVPGISFQRLIDTFAEPRSGNRVHHALDIPAPRGTPVLSVQSGRVLKRPTTKAGGLMVYVSDPTERYIYVYAHLDHYRSGLAVGDEIAQGDTIGFVGTTGNAPPNTPHLHFAIARSKNIKRWSKGKAVNPYAVFKP